MRLRLLALLALAPALLRAETLTIQNKTLRVDFDDAKQTFNLVRLADNKTILADVRLPLTGKVTHEIEIPLGDCLIVGDASNKEINLELMPSTPFLLIQEPFKNTSTQNQILNQKDIITFTPALDGPADQLMVRGTGGLHAAGDYATKTKSWVGATWDKLTRKKDQPLTGSYEWLAVAEPNTGHGLVAGFTTNRNATGVLTPKFEDGKFSINARVEYGRLETKPGQIVNTETFAIGYFDDVRLGLEAWADQVRISRETALPPEPAGFTTWYTEKNGGAADEKSLATLADFIAKNLKPYGLDFVQIDDRWQLGQDTNNGPDKNFTGSNPKGPYPSGMKAAADMLRADGLTPGLWFMPFAGAYNDPWFADKEDIFIKTKEGKPYDTGWGGTGLDMTSRAAQDYLRGIVTNITHDWGFSYLKIDGLYTGLGVRNIYVSAQYNPDDGFGEAVFSDPARTPVEAFRDGLRLVRKAAGPGVFILGCTVTGDMRVFGASWGLVDAMRIGPDNAENAGTSDDGNVGPPQIAVNWKTWREASPLFGSREYFLNGRVWWNDPDPTYVRASLSLDEARTEASWTAISGQLFTSSDWLPDLPAERLEILRRTLAHHGGTARPVDFMEHDLPRVWQLTSGSGDNRRDIIALFNFDDTQQTVGLPIGRFDLPPAPRYAAFDFWANAFLPDVTDAISVTLPPHACQVLAVRPMLDHPFVLSTSRHITQGMFDFGDESWDPTTRTLSGMSRVIGGDPYEIRIGAPGPPGAWTIKDCQMIPMISGIIVTVPGRNLNIIPAEDGSLRVTIRYQETGLVRWYIKF